MPNKQLRQFIRRYPTLRSALRRIYRGYQYNTARLLGRLREDKLELTYVNPNRIEYTVNRNDPTLTGNPVWHIGSVDDGDWDLNGVPVQEHDHIYDILSGRLLHKKEFYKIPQFQANVQKIEQGLIIESCSTPAEYLERWQKIESLYENIQHSGYKTQLELSSNNPLDEIRVQIGRKGEFLFEEGLHRLVIAQQLNLPVVPVLITRRHADWAALRTAVMRIVAQRGFIHQPFDHPDLDNLAFHYGNELAGQALYGHDRWRLISRSLPIKSGTILDIGAYFGYFDHRLEDLGFECFAVEPDRENLTVLNLYRAMYGREFHVWAKSIFDIEQFEFDIVLALNIFHHLVRTELDYKRLVDFLSRLHCQALYLEPDSNAGINAYKQFSADEFVRLVQSHTGLEQSLFLGQAKEGRPLYLLTR
jgi:2-polyprenyl-3-methyl-5-hydroxy-6-metoxy-1,4-benzoquinol methylase